MNQERIGAAVTYESSQDKIYVMGGYDRDSCEYYDVNSDCWIQFASLNMKKSGSTASILDNRIIYLFGGENNENYLDTIEQYDIVQR